MLVLAHGVGTRSDLPVPVGLAAAAAAAALLVSFAVLAVLWRRPCAPGCGSRRCSPSRSSSWPGSPARRARPATSRRGRSS